MTHFAEHEPFGIFLASSNAANDMQLLKRKNVSLVFSCQNYPVTEPYKKSVPSIILNLDGEYLIQHFQLINCDSASELQATSRVADCFFMMRICAIS